MNGIRDCSENDLRKFFAGCGPVAEVVLKRTFAFVEFENAKDAEHAIETMNGVPMDGYKLIVERPRKKFEANKYLGARGERGQR